MPKWEYITANSKLLEWENEGTTSVSSKLNRLGDQGWEMVSSDGIYLYFKRLKSSEEEKTEDEKFYVAR